MAALVRLLPLLALCGCAFSQYAEERSPRYIASESKPAVTPVPILKQINRHNEDGSYTYGYEAADGSFKIETKLATGEVKGKYGYKDDTGKVRVVEYGANKYGFQPSGEGITVAPPTLVDETTRENDQRPGKNQGGHRSSVPAQSLDYDYEEPAPAPPPRPAPRPTQQQQYRPAQQQQQQYRPAPEPQYRQAPAPQQQPQQQYRPPPQQSAAPTPPRPAFFSGAAPAPVQQDNFFSPAPQKPRQQEYQPKQSFQSSQQFQQSFAPRNTEVSFPQEQRFSPAPAQPQFAPQSQFAQQKKNPQFSMLDQLLKEFALPQGGSAPLHDITFGSY